MTRLGKLLVVAALVLLALVLRPALRGDENATIDTRFAIRGTQPVDGVAVVGVDDKTLAELHQQWPIRRALHAQLIDQLGRAQVKRIVYGVQFAEPSGHEEDDRNLRVAIARAENVILATGAIDDGGRTGVLGGEGSLTRAGEATVAAGTIPVDPDGTIRRYDAEDRELPTVAARIANTPGGLIDFRGPLGTIPTYSFSDVLKGEHRADLKDKIVVVGATAAALHDAHATAAGGQPMPGAEIQANAIWTALHGNPLHSVSNWVELLIAVLLGSVAPLAVRALGPIKGSMVAAVAGGVYALGVQFAFDRGLLLPFLVPVITLTAALAASLVVRAVAERSARARVTRYSTQLEEAVHERTKELAETQLEVVVRLAHAAELHDDDTGAHIERMSRLCGEVALELGLPAPRADTIRHAAVLHDVGKIGVPDVILRKPGPLTTAEQARMREHVVAGARLLQHSDSPLLQTAEVIASTHHERWDGSGYPNGLAGEEIPLEGRIAAVCDVFDALTHQRAYKEAWGVERACAEIAILRGTHFDPVVADALLAVVRRRAAADSGPVPHPV